jgi:uncharacterized protein
MAELESLEALREFIERDAGLAALREASRAASDGDPAHDVAHAERVAWWTLRLAPELPEREAIAAALLHDIVNAPKDSPVRTRSSELSAERARDLLPSSGFDTEAVARVCDAIRTHSFSRGETPRSELGRALQDADRLEALGALGLCRVLSTGAALGAHYFHEADPWARGRPFDDLRYTLDHFFTKLLGLAETLQTRRGLQEAQARVAFMRQFLTQLGREIGQPAPLELDPAPAPESNAAGSQ